MPIGVFFLTLASASPADLADGAGVPLATPPGIRAKGPKPAAVLSGQIGAAGALRHPGRWPGKTRTDERQGNAVMRIGRLIGKYSTKAKSVKGDYHGGA